MQYREFQNYHGQVAVVGHAIETKVSAGLNCRNMEQVNIMLQVGAVVSGGTIDVEIEESDDDGVGDAYASLTNAVFTQKLIGDEDTTFYGKIKVNTAGVKRWLRVSAVIAVQLADYSVTMLSTNLSGHIPVTVNALPTPEFSLNDVSA